MRPPISFTFFAFVIYEYIRPKCCIVCPVFSEVCSLVEVVGVEGVRHLLARIHKAVRDRVSRILRYTFLNTFVYASL